MIKKNKKKNFGFSLIELLVVISIIGVLTTVLVMNFVGSRERARDVQKIQNLNSLKNALRMYYNDNQSYPISTGSVGPLETSLVSGGYIPSLGDTIGVGYSSNGDVFRLQTTLEVGAGNEDVDSQKNCGMPSPYTDQLYVVCVN